MSLSISDKHVTNQRIINFDPPEPVDPKKSDSVYISKNVNGWDLRLDVEENGKITMIGRKTIGKSGLTQSEATISLTLETTDHRVPALKKVDSAYQFDPEFIEIDDRQDRVTESFKKENKDKYYRRQWPASSILTPNEFFSETIPDFEELLKDKTSNEYVSKISDKTAKVQKPYNQQYIQLEK